MASQSRVSSLLAAILLVGCLVATVCLAQDYDDDNYGNQGGNNQGDNDGYGGNANDDGYSGNMPNYQQNVDSEGTNNQPQNYNPQAGNDADGDYESDDNSAAAAASEPSPSVLRVRRSTDSEPIKTSASEPKLRVKRHGKYYIGPVYTYVKTDKHANFKWGVKHKVGKKHHG